MANQDNEEALIGYRTELQKIHAAQSILDNEAAMDLLHEMEQIAIDNLLDPGLGADERDDFLMKAAALAVRKLKEKLHEMADKRGYVEAQIQANSGEST